MSPYDPLITALKRAGARRAGNNWTCRRPSLSVTEGTAADGSPTVLVNCFAGCSTTE